MVTRALAILSLVAFCVAARAEGTQPEKTRHLLTKLGDDLAAAWRDYPTEKQKEAREAQIKKVTDDFNKALPTAEPPPQLSINATVDAYLDNLDKIRTLFVKPDKMTTVRSTYVTSCTAVFKKEVATAADLKETRSAQQCFEFEMQLLENARTKLRLVPTEVQTASYSTINEIMGPLFTDAKVVDKTDPVARMEQNLKEARNRFPVNTEDLKKINTPIINILEARAKQIKEKAGK